MTDHSKAVQDMAAGVGGLVLTLLGADAQTVTAALIGSVFGAGLAKPTSRWRAMGLFIAAVCAAAIVASVLGPFVSAWIPSISAPLASKGVALTVGILLHPIIQGLSVATPGLIKSAAERFGGRAS